MDRLRRSLARPRPAAAGIVVLIGLLAPAQVGLVLTRGGEPARLPIAIQPSPDPVTPTPSPSLEPSPTPTRKPKPKAKATKAAPVRKAPSPSPIWRGLGAWVDVYDFGALDPTESIALMKSYGTRTLYIQTGRYNTEHDVAPEVGPWLVAAHRAGIEVVGWYLPNYKNLAHDVKRTVAIATYRYQGERFDALGIDIEYKGDVRHVPTWNERVAEHARQVRAHLGKRYQIAAITPPPLQMEVAPLRWAGFPWRALATHTDAIVLMNYWSYRNCEAEPRHCAYAFTYENVRETRRLIARDRPVHVIGGVGNEITKAEVGDFVRATRDVKAFGGSLYDLQTTRSSFWPLLARLRDL